MDGGPANVRCMHFWRAQATGKLRPVGGARLKHGDARVLLAHVRRQLAHQVHELLLLRPGAARPRPGPDITAGGQPFETPGRRRNEPVETLRRARQDAE